MPPANVLRILDASLNRAGEGLRVVEDYVRFVLDDVFLTSETKKLRHELAAAAAAIPMADRHAARDTSHDVGTCISTSGEQNRSDIWAVCLASLKRTEQSFRSLEEYGKLADAPFAQRIEALRYRLYTLEKAIDIGRTSHERMEGVSLCVLVDGQESPAAFEELVGALIAVGVGMIQLRDKRLDDRELVGRAQLLRRLTRDTNTLAIINDRCDVAAIVHADGVHLGQEDVTVKDARAIVGTQVLIGVSTHNIEQARAAVLAGANYVGAGPTFSSATKEFASLAGLDYLRATASEIRVPTFAIGGITIKNLPDVLAVGITRIAVSAAVTGAKEPASAVRELSAMLDTRKDK